MMYGTYWVKVKQQKELQLHSCSSRMKCAGFQEKSISDIIEGATQLFNQAFMVSKVVTCLALVGLIHHTWQICSNC